MTDAEFKVLQELMAWHIGTCQSLKIGWRGYSVIDRALALIREEWKDRPITASLGHILEAEDGEEAASV